MKRPFDAYFIHTACPFSNNNDNDNDDNDNDDNDNDDNDNDDNDNSFGGQSVM